MGGCRGYKPRVGDEDEEPSCAKCLAFTELCETDLDKAIPEADKVKEWLAEHPDRLKVTKSLSKKLRAGIV